MIECVRRTSRNVKRWQSGDMALRWTAAGLLAAEQQFRHVIGYRDLAKFALAVERDHARTTIPSPTKRRRSSSLPDRHTGTAVAKFHDDSSLVTSGACEL